MTKLNFNLLFILCAAALCHADPPEALPLRLTPDEAAPVVRNLIASEKVLLEAVPVPDAPEWRSLELELPMEGFVATAALSKNFELVEETSFYKTPTDPASAFTSVLPGDSYQIGEAGESCTAITLTRQTKAYFQEPVDPPSPSMEAPKEVLEPPAAPVLNLPVSTHSAQSEPAAPVFDTEATLGTLAPEDLPPENVLWKSAPRSPAPVRQPQPQAADIRPAAPLLPDGIMVGPN